ADLVAHLGRRVLALDLDGFGEPLALQAFPVVLVDWRLRRQVLDLDVAKGNLRIARAVVPQAQDAGRVRAGRGRQAPAPDADARLVALGADLERHPVADFRLRHAAGAAARAIGGSGTYGMDIGRDFVPRLAHDQKPTILGIRRVRHWLARLGVE